MTTSVPVCLQPLMQSRPMPFSARENNLKEHVNVRGYSDSAVPTRAASVTKEYHVCNIDRSSQNDLSSLPSQVDLSGVFYQPGGTCTVRVVDRSSLLNSPTRQGLKLPTRNLISSLNSGARQGLKLPSFKLLGISSRLPDAPLTPPDEGMHDLKPVSPLSRVPRSASLPPPSPERSEFAAIPTAELSTTTPSSATQPFTTNIQTEQPTMEDTQNPAASGTGHGDVDPAHAGWVVNAVNAAVASMDGNNSDSVFVLCHAQPCPLPNDTSEADATTAFSSVISGVSKKIQSSQCWVQVTHAVPSQFSMNQIPNSPLMTPSVNHSGPTPTDYFSIETNVLSSAVVAISHKDALNSSVPSSPHPIVCPASISVSLLERYIPPPTAEEYLGLFGIDGPSVLVDRLIELSPAGGNLIFIYPTKAGADAFSEAYLGPLLHPLLRTMVSIHGLSMDFGAGIGQVGAVEQMYTYETMLRKIQILLKKLSRGTSSINPRQPNYTLIESSKQLVELNRKTWPVWWANQETPRMRMVVDRYLQRGVMMPTRIGGRDVTAPTLVQEVLDGVREGRSYIDSDPERKGVELGVFVIKRTA